VKLWNWLKVWWRGVPPTITELEDGSGWRCEYQNPNHPPARECLATAARKPRVKLMLGGVATVVLAVLAQAVSKWLGLS
jgi:hypothetical protein